MTTDLITHAQLAERWGTTTYALHMRRYRGQTPRWVKLGKSIHYRMADVLAFEEAHMHSVEAE